nr:MAG TPA: hypothetical protein [Caudoviricetes sp.]
MVWKTPHNPRRRRKKKRRLQRKPHRAPEKKCSFL